MRNYVLFDDHSWNDLLPLTYTKPCAELRIGILTIREKWENVLNEKLTFQTQEYLQEKYALKLSVDTTFINGKILPNKQLVESIKNLKPETGLRKDNLLIAYRTEKQKRLDVMERFTDVIEFTNQITAINYPWDIFLKNAEAIELDCEFLTHNRKSQPISNSNKVIGDVNRIFIEEGAVIEASIFNTKSGVIYIGKDAEVMEGSIVRGPFVLGEHSVLKLATKVYGPTTIGPHSKVGGEINNSVVMGYSNKAHDGFLGNSVVGEWCNLGADTNNSNLKNNYGAVKLFNYPLETMIDSGLQFCGLMMGDHSKCGINTMFNTGTVVGVGANIFGGGFPPNHIPSFTWGGAEMMEVYQFDKMIETTNRVLARRNLSLDDTDKKILQTIFNQTKKYRQK
ncbi:MAG: GlmU family protein [Bacteroidia bacterium]|nr:GlmU family protein [Bacteroidia bacterium]